jgi:hypothetical protein
MNISWATRPLFTPPPKVELVVKIVGLVVVILLIISPALVTLGWHLLNGNSIQARGKRIYVPLKWIADTGGTMSVQMQKLPVTILGGARFDGIISVGESVLLSNQKTEDFYKSFETLYWNLAGRNVAVSGPIRTGTGSHETFCMESTYPGTSNQVAARCLILQGKWDADFMGDKNDLGTFLQIIQMIN